MKFDDGRIRLFLLLAFGALLFGGSLVPASAVDWRHVGVPGDTYGKRVEMDGDTPALKFSDGQDTYAWWMRSTGELLLEYLGDTDILEVDTRGRVTFFKDPTADSDAATKRYVDNNAGGGDGGMSAWGDGSDTVTDPDTGVAGDNIDLVPSGTPGKFRLNASGGGSNDTAGLRFSDDGVFKGIYPEVNFGTDLGVSCSTDTCTVNSTAGGGSGSGWPGQGEILASDGTIYNDLSTAMSNADTYVILGPGTFADTVSITTDGFMLIGSGNNSHIDVTGVLDADHENGIEINANNVLLRDFKLSADGNQSNFNSHIQMNGSSTQIHFDNLFFSGDATRHFISNDSSGDFSLTDSILDEDGKGGNNKIEPNNGTVFIKNNRLLGDDSLDMGYTWIANLGHRSSVIGNDIDGCRTGIGMSGDTAVEIIGNSIRCYEAGAFGRAMNGSPTNWIVVGNVLDADRNDLRISGGSGSLFALNMLIGNAYNAKIINNGTDHTLFANWSPSENLTSTLNDNIDMNGNAITNALNYRWQDRDGGGGFHDLIETSGRGRLEHRHGGDTTGFSIAESGDLEAPTTGLIERSDTPTIAVGTTKRWLCEDSAGNLACDTGDVVESINNGSSTKHVIDIDFSAN